MLDPQYRPITLSTLTLVALAAFDGTAVTAALPRIGADLGVSGLPWVLTSFQFTGTVAMLAAGPLIDALGVRRAYRFTLILFFVSSFLCTVSVNLPMLVGSRALQGVGGGLVMAVTIANVGITYPDDLRPRAFAANSMVWGSMALTGPALVAFLVSTVSWRGVFSVNLPLVAFAAFIGWNRLPENERPSKVTFDRVGLALIAALVFVLLISLSELSWWSLAGVGVAGVLGWLYWQRSGQVAEPVMARRHFARWPFGWMNAAPFTLFAGALAVDAYLPIYVQGGLGKSAAFAAVAVAFLSFGWTVGSVTTSRLVDRIDHVDALVMGFAVTIPALAVAVATYSASTPIALVFALSWLQGLGIGSVTNTGLSILQAHAERSEMGRVSSAHQFMRHLGNALGTAVAGAVLLGVVASRIGSVEPVRDLLDNKADSAIGAETRRAIAAGFRLANVLALVLTIIGAVIAVRVRRRLKTEELGVLAAR